jgi:hypothetical protein
METVRAEIDAALQEEAAKAEDQEPELGPI